MFQFIPCLYALQVALSVEETKYLASQNLVSGRRNARALAEGAEYPDHVMNVAGDVVSGRPTWLIPHFQVKHHACTMVQGEKRVTRDG